MNDEDSLQLFCLHAFDTPSANPNFRELVTEVVKSCHGLPLALELLGRSLSHMSTRAEWEEGIKRLTSHKYERLWVKLRISYEALEDDEQEQMFQDVACFLVGEYEWRAK